MSKMRQLRSPVARKLSTQSISGFLVGSFDFGTQSWVGPGTETDVVGGMRTS